MDAANAFEEACAPGVIDRRHALGLIAGAGGLIAGDAAIGAPAAGAMMEDVVAYDAFGEHRTGAAADDVTSQWLARRLISAGFSVRPEPFVVSQFFPSACRLEAGGAAFEAFPGWPPATTPPQGVTAPLASADGAQGGAKLAGKIALVRLARPPGGGWSAPGVGDTVLAACERRPLAVVAITDSPTGVLEALNTDAARFADPFRWPAPVALVGARDGERLAALAATHAPAKLVLTGERNAAAPAVNIVGRRRGRGPTIVVSTPKTGWFHCAGERATGIAVFLDLAQWIVTRTDADLCFAAFAGHELDWAGARAFRPDAPPPDHTRAWLHIGANVAMQPLVVTDGVVSPATAPANQLAPQRRVAANPAVLAQAGAAFTAAAGYGPAQPLVEANAGGELSVFRADYPMLAGIVGANPLFHTRLDRAPIVTTPQELATVSAACRAFLSHFVGEEEPKRG